MIKKYDVIIIGGGAAGLMTAVTSSKRGKKTLLIEHNKQVGTKIIISGGGKCNFTNINARAENYLSTNINFTRSAFSSFTPENFIDLVKFYKIPYYEKTLGQLFSTNSSKDIVDMLLNEINLQHCDIYLQTKVSDVSFSNNSFTVQVNHNNSIEIFFSEKLVIATGGLSFPNRGATGFAYQIAERFGHTIVKTHPGLVPLTLEQSTWGDIFSLSGISFEAIVSTKLPLGVNGKKSKSISFKEKVLITHRGFSGPAILQISSYLQYNFEKINIFNLQLLNTQQVLSLFELNKKSNKDVKTVLSEFLPQNFAHYICSLLNLEKTFSQCTKNDLERLSNLLQNWEIQALGTEGYKKAEVTLGGIDTHSLNQKTMESNILSGLHFVGEAVDVTGWLGGYNFQWAWSSAYACGSHI